MNILGNKTDWAQKKGLHAKVWSYIDWTWKLAMALLVAWALSWCWDSRESFRNAFDNFWKTWSKAVDTWSNIVWSASSLVTGDLWDSWAKLGEAAWDAVWTVFHLWVWAVDIGIWAVKWWVEWVTKK